MNAIAILNTARIIKLLGADMLCVIEADNRIALTRFSDIVIKQAGGTPYDRVMLIDGNNDRGINVGLLTRSGFPIESITISRGRDNRILVVGQFEMARTLTARRPCQYANAYWQMVWLRGQAGVASLGLVFGLALVSLMICHGLRPTNSTTSPACMSPRFSSRAGSPTFSRACCSTINSRWRFVGVELDD